MPVQDLSRAMFAARIPFAHEVEPSPYILDGFSETLQLGAHVLATGLEGLHRRLYDPGVGFRGVGSGAVERAALEARHAGVKAPLQGASTDEEHARTVFSEIVPSLFGPDRREWVGMVKQIRDHQSHRLVMRFDEPSFARYDAAVESCRWAMVLRILSELSPGYDSEAKLAEFDGFPYALANLDRGELWEVFPALSEFRARRRQ